MNGIGALDDLSLFMGDDELMGGWSTGGDSLDDPRNAFLQRTAAIESGYGRDRLNPLSNATGLYQFLPKTWAGVLKNYPQLGFKPEDINSDEAQGIAARTMLEKEIIPGLRKALGREPSPQEIYTAWGLGTPDATRLFNAVKENPNALASPMFRPKVSEWNKNIFFHDKEGTQPRTVSEVAQAYANLWNGAKNAPPKGSPMQPPMQPEYDVEQGLSNIDQMGQRVAQMGGVSQMPAPPQRVGLSGLDPYLKIAAQLMPERQGSGWGDALINAGAAMMQSRSPDFLGAAGAGLQAGNQALQARRGQDRQDVMDRFKFGMGLAQFDQKDAGEYAMSDGVLYNKKTGSTQQVGAGKAPPTREVKRGDSIVTQEWNGTIWKDIGVADRREVPAGYSRDENGNLQIDPGYMRDQTELRRAGAPSVNVDLKGQTAGAQESAKLDAKKLDGLRSQADAAASALDDINVVDSWLKGLDTGSLAPEKLAAQKFLSGIGLNTNIFGTREQVGKAEAALTIVNQMALKLRNPESGLGMPGALSDKDMAFLKQSVVGLETTEPGRALIIDLTRRAANRRLEIARIADEFYYQNDNSFKGWPQFLKQWREANPLFSDADIAAAKAAAAAPRSGMPAARGLPESDAERTRRMEQERQDDEKRRGVYTPGTTIPLPPHPQAAPPVGGATTQTPPARRGDIPTFASPDDPALAKLPAGSVFYDNNGVLRVKP